MARFDGGWVRFDRRVLFEDIGANPNTLVTWAWCLGLANRFPTSARLSGKQVSVPVGAFVTGLKDLSNLTKLPLSTVRRSLDYLARSGRISQTIGTDGRLITVCNFERYANPDEARDTEEENERKTGGKSEENDRHHNGQDNNKQKNKERYISEFDFEKAAAVFPFQTLGANARKRFSEQIKTQADFDDLIAALTNYKAMLALPENDWRQPKTSFEIFLGTKARGYFWRDFIDPASAQPKKTNRKAAVGALQRTTNPDDEVQSIMSEVFGDVAI